MQRLAVAGLCLAALVATAATKNAPIEPTRPGIALPPNSGLPAWLKPNLVQLPSDALSLRCGKIELCHSREVLGGFEVRVDGKSMAIGQNRSMIGYVMDGKLCWLDLAE